MKLILNGNDYHYALEQLIRVFFPDIKLEKIYDSPLSEGEFILCESVTINHAIKVHIRMHLSDYDNKAEDALSGDNLYKAAELRAAQLLYNMLTDYTGYTPQWGIQTGVRPTKIYFNLLRHNSEAQAVKYLEEQLLISESKTQLIKTVCHNEKAIIDSTDDKQFSLYVSVPFCPSRCAYCSFISHSYESIKKLIPAYVEKLCLEIKTVAKHTASLGLRPRTVYIGGGTPTVLSTAQLNMIFKVSIQFHFKKLYHSFFFYIFLFVYLPFIQIHYYQMKITSLPFDKNF